MRHGIGRGQGFAQFRQRDGQIGGQLGATCGACDIGRLPTQHFAQEFRQVGDREFTIVVLAQQVDHRPLDPENVAVRKYAAPD